MDSSTQDIEEVVDHADNGNNESSKEEATFSVDLEDLKDKYLRAQAEVENVRRRSQDELTKVRLFGAEKFVRSVLPICDSIEMALGVESQTLETLRGGVEMTYKQVQKLFSDMDISPIEPINEKFDPNCHQAMATEESDELPPNHIVKVLQKGYRLHDRVIRAALVIVSKEKDQKPQE